MRRAYLLALEGVGQWALFEAERRINQNSLGHPYMPSPAELRGEIDRVMAPHVAARRREAEAAHRYKWADDDKPRALPAPKGDPEAVAKWRVRRAAQKAETAVTSASAPTDRPLFADRDERMKRTAADAVSDFVSRQDRRHDALRSESGIEAGLDDG
ncbi:hypothetical protein N2597_07540 [Rhizobium sophoriradicis]|uniref:hypothetical protein n=1 Tax=Rhizobium sophoriradicis TaxID=1535245 RepID=UPI00181088DD|nr:hypothetical protein N2597_07540 [Rhizobium leguminosarum bv. phaseoli]